MGERRADGLGRNAVAVTRADAGGKDGRLDPPAAVDGRAARVAVANEAAQRGDLGQRAVQEHVGGAADPPGPGVERAVLGIAEDRDRLAFTRLGERERPGAKPRDAQDSHVLSALDDECLRRPPRDADVGCPGDDVRRGDDPLPRRDQPEPSTPSPHAMPVIRTTLARARCTDAEASTRRFGGRAGGAGPTIDWNGSTRFSALSTVLGGAISFSRLRITDCCTSRRSVVCPGSCRSTAPATQTSARPAAAPASSPPRESSSRSGGINESPPRANEPPTAAIAWSSAAPINAPISAASGVYGEWLPPVRKCGAARAPSTAPAASPPNDNAVAISPRRNPESAATPAITTAIQSTRVTRLTLAGGSADPPLHCSG